MAEPLITTTAGTAITVGSVTTIGLFMHSDGAVLLGALAGALICLVWAQKDKEYSPFWRWILFVSSIAAGVIAAPFTAELLTALTPSSVNADKPIGAFIAGAVAVKVLAAFASNPGAVFTQALNKIGNIFGKGGGSNGK